MIDVVLLLLLFGKDVKKQKIPNSNVYHENKKELVLHFLHQREQRKILDQKKTIARYHYEQPLFKSIKKYMFGRLLCKYQFMYQYTKPSNDLSFVSNRIQYLKNKQHKKTTEQCK